MNNIDEEFRNEVFQLTSDFLAEVLEWVHQDGKPGTTTRAYALLYMVNPNRFGNQTEFAKSIGVSKKVLCTTLTSFKDTFGYSLPTMRKDAIREKYSQLKTEYHHEKNKNE